MKISVIIPVYNASSFIENAVKSAHHFDCVSEIILIEDGSTDNSLDTCKEIVNQFDKVSLYSHPNNTNKGAGASRNLGIEKANNQWIAFLDADDIFLENRFNKELEYYNTNIEFDGVYGALGAFYSNDELKEKIEKKFTKSINLTTVSEEINATDLKYVLLNMHPNTYGYFHLDTLTVKKSLLQNAGLFNPKLRLHQDTDLILKLSLKGSLLSGEIKNPIAKRGVHLNNRITNNPNINQSRYLLYKELNAYLNRENNDDYIRDNIFNNMKYFEFMLHNKKPSIFKALMFSLQHKSLFFNQKIFNTLMYVGHGHHYFRSFILNSKKGVDFLFKSSVKKYNFDYSKNRT